MFTSNRVGAVRLDATQVRIDTDSGLDIRLFANEQVPIDRASLAEIGVLSGITLSVRDLAGRGFFGDDGRVERCVLTPDFHKGAGIPVGTVLETRGLVFPRAAGRDIGCGMKLLITDMEWDEFEALGPGLDRTIRHAFFEGGRNIPLSEAGRDAMLRHGLPGLVDTVGTGGLWDRLDAGALNREIAHSHRGGSWPTDDLWMFSDYVRGSGGVSRDAMVASIGGGNHFCEVQRVHALHDGGTCWQWGVRPGRVAVMVHSGSLDLGSSVGDRFMDLARDIHPAGVARPGHGFHPLPLHGPLGHHGRAYLSVMGLAANFAVVNRLLLGLLALDCLSRAAGRTVRGTPVYDAPHNLVWVDGDRVLHRKGACPAEADMGDGSFPAGIPVIVPGSMGAESWLLRGLGGTANLRSAPHGAGRLASRGEGRRGNAEELQPLRVVTKIDPVRVRRDVAAEIARDLLEEAPSAYKPVLPAVETCLDAGMAAPVAVLRPLLTVKG